MASQKIIPTKNLLLDALSDKSRLAFLGQCELVHFNLAQVIYEAGEPITYVYFPLQSIVSLVNPVDKNAGMEVALIGNEGMLGITLMLESKLAPFRAIVQGAGSTLRIEAKQFLEELKKCPELELRLKRYICVSFSQLVQMTVCNRFHVVEERLARLLLMIYDRKESVTFKITQQLLAQMLGVRRVGVSKAATSLKQKALITYNRGYMDIHDLAGLEASSCICYQTDKQTYNAMLEMYDDTAPLQQSH
ncbi:MAG: Crp/Fnr family transcriptional regulator [Methylotenera sp.]|nr:MAG: Crp/Fnr family transcriptional regulator [Methylotenera sp.]